MTTVKRDKGQCLERLAQTKDGGVLTRVSCRIQVPVRWMNVGLGSMGESIAIYGFFPIMFEDDLYAVMNVCALITISPSRTSMATIEEEAYYEFHFDPGTVMIRTLNLILQDTLTFNVLDEFIMKGKVPWWGTVDDLCSIFNTAKKHAGSAIAKIPQTIEFLVGITARTIEERTKVLRQTATSWEDYQLDRIEFIALNSVHFSVNNTVSRLSGSYFHQGVISALVNPSTKTSKVERILRT